MSAASGCCSMSTTSYVDALAVQLAPQPVAVAAPRRRVHGERLGGRPVSLVVLIEGCRLRRLDWANKDQWPGSGLVKVSTIVAPGVVPCSTRPPSSRASTPSSAGSPKRSAVRSACSPAPAPARPGRSPTASPTAWRRASTSPPRCWRSPSPPERPARCAAGCAGLGIEGVQARTFHSAALRQLRYFWPHIHGTELPTLTESKLGMLATAASRQRVRPDKATSCATSPPRSSGPRSATSVPTTTPASRCAPAAPSTASTPRPSAGCSAATRRSSAPSPAWTWRTSCCSTAGTAGRRRARRRPGPPPVQVVRRRRVPGRLAAPVGAPRPVARRPRRDLRRRRPGPDDLLVRRRRRELPP